MPDRRLNPETLLQRVQEEERSAHQGKLKIYLGAAPGVGKTYTMLQDAISKRAQGLDVVLGVVESHGRKEIEALIKDLDILPRQQVLYHGKDLLEFDLDAALKRSPALILIDEMAHTNVPGVRHTKRWQDIKELLDRGIDVYTTLNVQHIESLNDMVSQIIHSRIKETVPDTMLEMADTIELVDLPPEDLLRRLQEGKVYFPAQAALAKEHFFRKGNLIALRELALRITAERVGAQVLLYRQGQGIQHVWPTKDKILVYVGSGPESIKLIRTARRMAINLKAEWIAIHVDSPQIPLSSEQQNNAIHHLRLAEQLGAETRILIGMDIVTTILTFAHEQNITEIVLWKRVRSRWRELFWSDVADKIIRRRGEIDVYIVSTNSESTPLKLLSWFKFKEIWQKYVATILAITGATLINFLIFPYVRASNLIMVYLLSVCLVALFGELGPSIIATVLGVLAYNFFFIPPYYSFALGDIRAIFTLFFMLILSAIISYLAAITHKQAKVAQLIEKNTATLHSLSRQLASTRGIDKLLITAVRYLTEVFSSEVIIFLPENGQLIRRQSSHSTQLSEKEHGVALWVYNLGQVAGLGTDTLPFADSLYIPLLTSQGTLGVIRLRPFQEHQLFTPEKMHLLEACASQIALALEVDRLHEQTKNTELETETNRIRNTLLQAVSHDLRTPLVAIMGAASTLIEMPDELDSRNIVKLGNEIYLESEQLNRLINNLLEIFYLESNDVQLQKKPIALHDIIQAVLSVSNKKLGDKHLTLQIPDDLIVPVDSTLLQEVLLNLLDNAIKFSPSGTNINITAKTDNNTVVVSVEDQGPGIVPDEENKLFEKYYRGRQLTTERGLGLGLAICRIVIAAHGGKIWAENRPEGGAAFRFTLPLE